MRSARLRASATRAIVLLSGGLDSAVSLYWAKSRGWKIQTLSFNYFGRSRREIAAARKLAARAQCPLKVIDLPFLKELADLRRSSRSLRSSPRMKVAPSAYIPSRNVIFYGIASSLAEVSNSKYIVGGHNKDDVNSFPDAGPKFFRLFNSATKTGLATHGQTSRVVNPISKLTKAKVVRLGRKLGVPFRLTWSCYFSGQNPCGECPACELRKSAFKEAGIRDPLML